jgi:outer membrane protein assembly factor BamE (lipoprotein component of BamABCDE complex)
MMAAHSIEVWLVALAITICLIGSFGAFARWCSFSPAVPREALDKLRVGMTTYEVLALLGPPRQTRTAENGHRHWIFGAPMKRHVLLIEFNSHEAVESFAHGVPGRRAPRKDNI